MDTPRGFVRRVLGRASLVLFVTMHLACLLVIVYPPTWPLVLLALGSYALRMWAITAGFHRYFAHRSFRTSRVFQFILALIGTTAMENGPIWWASWHRRHHKYVDTPADPHSPLVYGFWYSHVAWVFDPKNDTTDLSNVRDLTRFPELRLLDRFAWVPLLGYALLCYAIAGLPGVTWGFFVSTIAVNHATFSINSLAHMWGSRRYDTPDTSRNNPLLALLTFGEGWHNNHHFYMSSARQGFRWWELDVSYYTLLLLSKLHIVRDVRKPPVWMLEGHARASDAGRPSGVGSRARTDDDRIDEAGEGSFPASDSPPWTLGSARRTGTRNSSRAVRAALNRIIVASHDEVIALRAGNRLVGGGATTRLAEQARRRLAFQGDLAAIVTRLGGTPAKNASFAARVGVAARRVHALLIGPHQGDAYAACARATERATDTYWKALRLPLPLDVRSGLEQQYGEVDADRQDLRRLRWGGNPGRPQARTERG